MSETVTACNLTVEGMHCDSCELYLEGVVKKQKGVKKVVANSRKQQLAIELDNDADLLEITTRINEIVTPRGYTLKLTQSNELVKKFTPVKKYLVSFILALALILIFLLAQRLNLTSFFSAEKLTYPSIFILGVFASLTSCMAVVGGLVLSLSSTLEAHHQRKGIAAFHIARIVGFAFLGGLTGALGRMIVINGFIAELLKIAVSLVMFGIGLDMLGIKLPKLVFPKQFTEMFDIFSDKEGVSGAILLGISTYFLPCAFTQSMQLYSLSTGSFLAGALTMMIFSLGTLPVLAFLSFGSVVSIEKLRKSTFQFVMAFILILLALFNIAAALGFAI